MASVCMPQTGYQQHQQQHHFQMLNGNIMLLQKAQHQQQQLQQQNLHTAAYQHKKHQTIAPAPKVLGNSNLHNIQVGAAGGGGGMLPRKKYTYMNVPYGEQLPSVARRNARERNRVKQVNNGFANLRQHLPQTVINTLSHGGRGASKKLSKVDTLRIAVEYIRGLQDMLDESQPAENKFHTGTLCDESSNDGSNYGYSSMGSPSEAAYNQLQQSYHSEASVSPAPSFSGDSDISIGGVNYLQPVKLEHQQLQQQQHQQPAQTHFKFESFDEFAHLSPADEQPDDEELLDYISSWQEQ
ncbi:PREDICTED: achaete-scute complex protein T3-like [Rhagoletis zephyria]|uniref:achaete-scute complex protein T3-like n=1 Tax=Rhagoletis zephyria TaxID=28612 RepID=UPI000811A057|nr:PREDICTED: achaete-scute complex protein T3-like [Rhagoletis zephyria]